MVNQMTKFSLKIVHISKPLNDLLSTKNSRSWEAAQAKFFNKLKEKSPHLGC